MTHEFKAKKKRAPPIKLFFFLLTFIQLYYLIYKKKRERERQRERERESPRVQSY